ncbi:MAG: hypothetical protein AABY64_06640 [Bdellovibrionota bacterium]
MKNLSVVILGSMFSLSAFAEIPTCLKNVVNQVSICKEKIESELAIAEKIVNKNKSPEEQLHYGETISFPTMIKGEQAILSLTKTNRTKTQVIYFSAQIKRGLFWKNECSVSVITSDMIPKGTENEYLSKTFGCE